MLTCLYYWRSLANINQKRYQKQVPNGWYYILSEFDFRIEYHASRSGKYYFKALIPEKYRHHFNNKPYKLKSCGKRARTEKEAYNLLWNSEFGQNFRQQFLDIQAEYDPLIVSAERFLQNLFQPDTWDNSPVTQEELKVLKNNLEYPQDYSRVVNLLRYEMTKFIEYGTEVDAPDITPLANQLKYMGSGKGLMSKPVLSKEIHKTIDMYVDNFQDRIEEDSKKPYFKVAMVGRLRRIASRLVQLPDVTQSFVEDLFKEGLATHGIRLEDVERFDKVHETFSEFERLEQQKSSGLGTAGATFKEVQRLWLENEKNRGNRNKTVNDYLRLQNVFVDNFLKGNDIDLKQIDKQMCYEFCAWLQNEWVPPLLGRKSFSDTAHNVRRRRAKALKERKIPTKKTIANYKNAVSRVLTFATRQRQIAMEENPWFGVDVSDYGVDGKKRASWSSMALRKLFSSPMPPHLKLILRLLICTGSRLEEIVGLRWHDIKVFEGVLSLDFTSDYFILKESGGTVGIAVRRRTPIVDIVRPYLEEYRKNFTTEELNNADQLIFRKSGNKSFFLQDDDGKYSDDASKRLLYWVDKVRDKSSVLMQDNHSLRTTFITLATSNMIQDSMVRKIVGHKQIGENSSYNWEAPREYIKVYEAMNSLDFTFIHGGE